MPSARPPMPQPRSLADDLRMREDPRLADLLRLRPDLLHPVPPDLAALVARASTSVSTARALDRCDAWSLQVLEALAALPEPCGPDDVVAAIPTVSRDRIEQALDMVLGLALVWGTDELHLVRAAREAFGTWPCGLHPPGLAHPAPAELHELLAALPEECRVVLDQLVWGPPVGSLPDAQRVVTRRSARTPVEWLLARNLLVPVDGQTVALPREVALALRDGAFLRDPAPEPPPVGLGAASGSAPDREAGQQAVTAVRWAEELLERWSVTPPAQLRSGGLGVRELTAAARLLEVEEPVAVLVVEVAHAAGLLASDEEEQPRWLPTPAYDLWLAGDPADRWAELASAWLTLPRAPVLAHGSAERANALSAALERADAAGVRRLALDALAAATGPADADAVVAWVNWTRPRRASPTRDLLVRAALHEAGELGIGAGGTLTAPGRALLESGAPAAAEQMRPLMPEPLDHVLLQADLTAVAPGPLESTLARELSLLADVESRGAATVYRFTPATLRRAFDAGRSAHDVLTLLQSRSRTPVPQPLAYLVEDIARRHGVVRVGVAASYLRCDDEATVSTVLADRRAARLRPVRLAPGVLALQVGVEEALTALREMGLAPAAEAPDGTVLLRRPDALRAPARRRRRSVVTTEPATPDDLLVAAAVRALRAGDRVAERAAERPGPARLGRIPVSTPGDTVASIRVAIESEQSLWIGYADTDGRATERIIDPIEVSRGFLTAYDHRYEEVRSFALARITGVATYDGSST